MNKAIIFLIASLSLILVNCSSSVENESAVYDLTQADVFVNSTDYESYERIMKKDKLMMISVFKKMTSNEKQTNLKLAENGACDSNNIYHDKDKELAEWQCHFQAESHLDNYHTRC